MKCDLPRCLEIFSGFLEGIRIHSDFLRISSEMSINTIIQYNLFYVGNEGGGYPIPQA